MSDEENKSDLTLVTKEMQAEAEIEAKLQAELEPVSKPVSKIEPALLSPPDKPQMWGKGKIKTGGRVKGSVNKGKPLAKIIADRLGITLDELPEFCLELGTHLLKTAPNWSGQQKVWAELCKYGMPKNVNIQQDTNNKFEIVVTKYLDDTKKKKLTGTDAEFTVVEPEEK